MTIRQIGAGHIDEGEAALTAIGDDAQADRMWPGIGALAQKALTRAKADVRAGWRPFAGSVAKARGNGYLGRL